MNKISEEILEKYQIRKTKKQKAEFIEFMRAHFPNLKIEKGGFGGNRNIVIGEIDTAKAVLTAHYDTCAVLPFPNFIMPERPIISFGYGFVIAMPIVVISAVVGALIGYFTKNAELASYLSCFAFWIAFVLMFFGKPNKHTVNDNTGGVITLVELLSDMSEEERNRVCFVFFDNEENGLLGSAFFEKKHRAEMKDKLLINFDCVSDGDCIMFAANKPALLENEEKLKKAFENVEDKTVLIRSTKGIYYPSDQANFKKSIAVAAFKKSKFGIYLDKIHTAKDTVMDERNISLIVSGIKNFLFKLN